MGQRRRGELEALIMDALWDSASGLTGAEIADALPQPTPAITTVLTVLERMRDKALVVRAKAEGRGYRYSAAVARNDSLVNSMVESLTSSTDRTLTLLHFAGTLTDDDRAVLRRALDAN